MNLIKALSVATAGLLPVLGFSATIVSTDTHFIQNAGTTTLSLAYFDSNLGTLTGVNVSVGMTLADVNVAFDNDSLSSNTGWAILNNTTSSFGSNSAAITNSLLPIAKASDFTFSSSSGTFALGPTSGDPTTEFNAQPGNVDFANFAFGTTTVTRSGDIGSLDIGSYLGLGDFNLNLNTIFFTAAMFSGADGRGEIRTGDATFTSTVTYTYTAIPEPSTYALIFGALTLGMVGWRRFRK